MLEKKCSFRLSTKPHCQYQGDSKKMTLNLKYLEGCTNSTVAISLRRELLSLLCP
ncbi:rCG52118 [Rattus norvegicus]|uniref:RCG52118 n=1 Tax=Rattus norvegicus TaxID=10116 RepID=A6K6G0_RAT|nr:rCG52118 [Rattus norvegicus]